MTTDRTPDSDREAAIRARLEAATQLPWKVYQGDVIWYTHEDYERVCDGASAGDAALIANAPDDLRYLLTALSEARAALAAAEAVTAWSATYWNVAWDKGCRIVRQRVTTEGVPQALAEFEDGRRYWCHRSDITDLPDDYGLDAVLREEGASDARS